MKFIYTSDQLLLYNIIINNTFPLYKPFLASKKVLITYQDFLN